MSNSKGTLYIIATPIGNLDDISSRAITILNEVKYIAAEDTRQSKKLLNHYGITTQLVSHHKFNERKSEHTLINFLRAGNDIALISDAGTPLICDPGVGIVRLCHESGIKVVPVPGPSALIAALSVSGVISDKFVFEGFLPEKKSLRRKLLETMRNETRTMAFFEAPHRIMDSLNDLNNVFSADRQVVIARELTKKFETIYRGTVGEVREKLGADNIQQKGEFVVIIEGTQAPMTSSQINSEKLLSLLLPALPLNKASGIVAEVTGESKNTIYKMGLEIQKKLGK